MEARRLGSCGLRVSSVASLVLGAVGADEVAGNLRALDEPIPPDLWEALRAAGLLDSEAPTPTGSSPARSV